VSIERIKLLPVVLFHTLKDSAGCIRIAIKMKGDPAG